MGGKRSASTLNPQKYSYWWHYRWIDRSVIHHHNVLKEVACMTLPPRNNHPRTIVIPHHRLRGISRECGIYALKLPKMLVTFENVVELASVLLVEIVDLQSLHVQTDI